MVKRNALGKGLSALIPDAKEDDDIVGSGKKDYFQCPVDEIVPNPYQPRLKFASSEMDELAASVKEKGIITPILVSKHEDGYRLIAGERRWRAAQKAGLERVPVVVRETTPMESLELAIIENIHRQDLNPVEEALAYKRWLEDSKLTQETLAQKVGKDRSTITNLLRLLKLPNDIKEDLIEQRLTMGHARVLVGMDKASEQRKVRDLIIKRELSVRKVEKLLKKENKSAAPSKKRVEEEHYFGSLADGLKKSLGTKVEIKRRGKQGSINIHFYSDDELSRLLDLLP